MIAGPTLGLDITEEDQGEERVMLDLCPHCGCPDTQPVAVVSRHPTAEGETVWTRCGCGSLQVRLLDESGVRITARGRPVFASPADAGTWASTGRSP